MSIALDRINPEISNSIEMIITRGEDDDAGVMSSFSGSGGGVLVSVTGKSFISQSLLGNHKNALLIIGWFLASGKSGHNHGMDTA